jgi:hypothetical protein
MASPILPQTRNATSLEAFGRDVARRREALGKVDMPGNDGTRRTPEKRALLTAIAAAGGKW